MQKSKKIKITLGLIYLLITTLLLYFFFSKFTLAEIGSYEFIKNNREYFSSLRQSNIFLLCFVFLFLVIIWVLLAGFGSPMALLSGFIFGKWLGTILVVVGLTIGATILYVFANYFLKDIIKKKFSIKFKKLEEKFKRSEFNYLLIYRFIGGIPFALSNIIPCIFNVKVKNFFLATFIGILPQLFLVVSIGSGLEKIIEQNLQPPRIVDLLYSSDIYIPIIAFIVLLLITIVARKVFYKK